MALTDGSLLYSTILKDMQILSVDNHRDSGDLYSAVLEKCGARVITTQSIKQALDHLNWLIPNILICEMRFLGESVYPLIQRVRDIALNHGRTIPILVISTYSPVGLTKHLTVKVEGYQIKPIELDQLIKEVWDLVLLPNLVNPSGIQDQTLRQALSEELCRELSGTKPILEVSHSQTIL